MSKQTFDFSEALRRMKEGKKVRRIGWGIVDKLWIDKDKNINIFYKATTHSSEGFIHIFPSCWSFSLAKIFSQQTGRRWKDEKENIDPHSQQAVVRYDCCWREDGGVPGD